MKKNSRQGVSAQALIFLGQAQEGLRQWARAIETYQEVWLQYPLLPLAKNAKSKWESLAKEKKLLVKKIPPPALFRRALHFYQARLYEVALSEIERLEGLPLQDYPQNYAGESWIDDLYFHRGMCLFYLKQYSRAIEAFHLVVRHSRNEEMAEQSLFWTTRALFRLGRKEEALNTFSLFQKTYPQSPFMDRALYLTAQIFDEGGDITQAIAIYRELAERFPQSSLRFQAMWQSGWLLFKNQELREAIQAWDFLQTLHPHSPWPEQVLYWKGKALLAMERPQEAEE
ncbi:MAG: tetratricopeptide repeat protein, partial [Deltaproteobacteria bacterium]|nr:tetratricopeptide repeat protein [Deltaproteobacteria bacterium]